MMMLNQLFASILSPAANGLLDSWTSPHVWIPAGIFVASTGLFWLVAARAARRHGRQVSAARELAEDAADAGLFGSLTPALAAQLPEARDERQQFQQLLRTSGMYRPDAIENIKALRFVLLVAPLVLAGVFAIIADRRHTGTILMAGAIAAAVCSLAPRLYLLNRRARRRQAVQRGLPDTLDMLSMCLEGGMALSPSLAHVAGQIPYCPELAEELLILKRQAEIGSIRQALADFAARNELPEARQLVGLLSRGERLGARVAGSLLEQSDRLRESRRQWATRQANKAPVKLVLPIMFCFAPAALILLVSPALLELKEFLAPTAGQSVLAENEGLGTGAIFRTLENLDQTPSIP